MHPRKVLAIVRKDLRDGLRNSKILLALLLPLGLGLLYNAVFSNSTRQKATVAYAAAAPSVLQDELRSVVGPTVDLTFKPASSAEEVRQLIADKQADVGIVVPPGFDAAVHAGETPQLVVLRRSSQSFAADFGVTTLEEAIRRLAGQQPAATIAVTAVEAARDETTAAIDRIGVRHWMVLTMAVLLVGMTAVYIVPSSLTEETDRKTLDALSLIASYIDIITAKALVGVVYLTAGVPLLLIATGLRPADPVTFSMALLLLSVALIGCGLLLGGLFRTSSQFDTWSGLILLALIFPVFLTALPLPALVLRLFSLHPASQAMRLVANGEAGTAVFSGAWLAYLVVLAWGAGVYLLLWYQLSRREA
jgi:ABC-2 type transport system permease protein